MKNEITYKVTGKRALFSEPGVKFGGEKSTYCIPTYEALRGLTESIYWKPTIEWVIDKVRIVNKIKKISSGKLIFKYTSNNKNDLASYQYLVDVCYEVQAHFIFNTKRPDLKHDFNENKHHNIALRSVNTGGRYSTFLGCSECFAMIEPCEFGEDKGYYDNIDMDFDRMFHRFIYPYYKGSPSAATFWTPKMVNGVIDYTDIKEEDLKTLPIREVHEVKHDPQIVSVDDEYEEVFE